MSWGCSRTVRHYSARRLRRPVPEPARMPMKYPNPEFVGPPTELQKACQDFVEFWRGRR